ncbi:MAG TPA: hypothetical protein VGM56_30390 [Byssovorax sp.]|jgi:hypothetical protein
MDHAPEPVKPGATPAASGADASSRPSRDSAGFPTATAAAPRPRARRVDGRPAPPAGVRALNLIAFAATATALGLVAASATPAVLRATGLASPTVAVIPRALQPSPVDKGFGALPTGGLDPQAEIEKLYKDGLDPRDVNPRDVNPRDVNPRDANPRDFEDPDEDARARRRRADIGRVDKGSAELRMGRALRAVPLLQEPGDLQHETGLVQPNQSVMIVKEVDGWLLVYGGAAVDPNAQETTMGWAKKSEIAVR